MRFKFETDLSLRFTSDKKCHSATGQTCDTKFDGTSLHEAHSFN